MNRRTSHTSGNRFPPGFFLQPKEIMKTIALLATLWIMAATPAQALDSKLSANAKRMATDLCELRIVPMEQGPQPGAYAITLNGNVIMKTGGEKGNADFRFHGFPQPVVALHLIEPVPPFEEVFVIRQQTWGEGCENGPIWLLGVRSDGSHVSSEAIDRCGGPPPRFTYTAAKLTVTLPGYIPKKGKRPVPEEVWVYTDGQLRRPGKGKGIGR